MKKLKVYLKDYYVNSYFLLQYAYNRGRFISIILLIVRQLQFLSLIFTPQVEKDILAFNVSQENSLLSTVITMLHYFRFVPLQIAFEEANSHSQSSDSNSINNGQSTSSSGNSSTQSIESTANQNFLIFATVITSYILLYLLIRPLLHLLKGKKQYAYIQKNLDWVCSFLMKWFAYLLMIPFIQVSIYELFNSNSKLLSWYCLLSTILISIIQTIHEFSYSFILKDILAKRDSFENQIDLLIIFVYSMLFANTVQPTIVTIIHIIFTLYQIYSFTLRLYFYHHQIQRLFIIFRFSHISVSSVTLLFLAIPSLANYCDIQITILVCLPIFARFSLILRSYRVVSLLLKEQEYSDPQALNLHIRNVFSFLKNLDMHDYTIIQKGVLYESIYENHYYDCKRVTCFCHSLFRENGFSWEELHGHKYRDRFLTSYITQLFSEYIVQKTRLLKSSEEFHKLRFSYLSFLIEVVNVPTSSYVQVVSMINLLMKQSNLKEQMIFKSMEYKANQTFYNFFHNPSVYNQRLHLNRVIEFDDIYKDLQKQIKTCILLLRDMYVLMMEDYIDLDQLLSKGTKIIKFKEQIHSNLKTLFSYNANSQRAFEMCQIYSDTLDLMKKKPKQYIMEAQLKGRKIFLKRNRDDPETEINLFSQEACVIYISLLEPIGTIKRISQSTLRVFGFQQKECIGKNCNIFIPNEINKIHNEILNRFVEGGQLKGINVGELKMFGVKKTGFAFPIKFRLKLDPTLINDFGVCGFFQVANQGNEYILFDMTGKITNTSEKIFKTYFQDIYGEKNIWKMKELDILKMLPLLGGYLEQVNDSNVDILKFEFNSVLIYPLVKDKYKAFQHNSDSTFDSMAEIRTFARVLKSRKCGFLSVTFRIGRLENSYTPLKVGFIQIEKHKRIQDKHHCLEEIDTLIQNLEERKKYLDIANNIINQKSLTQQKSIMNNNNNKEKSTRSITMRQPSLMSKHTSSPKRQSIMSQITSKQSKKSIKVPSTFSKDHPSHKYLDNDDDNSQNGQSNQNEASKYKASKFTSYNNLETHNNITDNDVIMINLNALNNVSTNIQTQFNTVSNSYSNDNEKIRLQFNMNDNESHQVLPTSHFDMIPTQQNLNTTQNNLIQLTTQNNESVFQLDTSNQFDQITDLSKGNRTAIFKSSDQKEFDVFDSYNFDEQRKKIGGGARKQNHHSQYMADEDSVGSPKKQRKDNTTFSSEQQFQQQKSNFKTLSSSDDNKNNASKNTKDKDSNEQFDLKQNEYDFSKKVIQVAMVQNTQKNELNQFKTNETFGAKQQQGDNQQNQSQTVEEDHHGVDLKIDLHEHQPSSSFLTDSDDDSDISEQSNTDQAKGLSINGHNSNIRTQFDALKSYVDIPHHQKNKKNRRQTLDEVIAEVSNDSNMAGSQQGKFDDDIQGNREILNFVNKQDASSVHSGKTEFHSFKKMLQSGLSSKKSSRYMTAILVTGYLTILIFITITTVFFIQIRNYFSDEIDSYQMIVQGHNTKNVLSNVIADKEFLDLHTLNVIPTDLSSERQTYYQDHLMSSVTFFRNKIKIFQEESQGVDYANYLSTTFQNTTFYNERNSSMSMTFSKIFSLIITAENLYFYAKYGREVGERYILTNQENAFNIFDGITERTNNQSERVISQIQDLLVFSIVILEIICFLAVSTAIPMFYSVQKQREEILKLFCTFQPNKLLERVDQCFAYTSHSMLESVGIFNNLINPHEVTHNKRPNHPKKRSTSNSSDLKKYNIPLFFAILLIICLLSISPFTNYYTSQEFVNEFRMNIDELQTIFQFRGLLPMNFAINYLTIKAIAQNRTEWIQPLKTQLDALYQASDAATADLVSLSKNFEDSSRYDYSLYKSIVKEMLYKEVCQTFETYKSYSYNGTLFNLTDCKQAYYQIWSNGFVIGIKAILAYFNELRQVYNSPNYQSFISSMHSFDSNQDMNAFQDLYYYCQSIPELLGSFMITSSIDYYNGRQYFLLQIFIFAFVLNSFILLYAWQAFYRYLSKLTFETKSILGVFSYDFVVDNPFIISYVKKEFSIT